MKNIQFLFVLMLVWGCQSNNYVKDETLTPTGWYDVLGQALIFSQNLEDNILVFNEYYNAEMEDMIQYVYGFICEEYDIDYNDTIPFFLANRTNRQVSENIALISEIDVEIVVDTTSVSKKVFFLSEPFHFSPGMLGFSLSVKEKDEGEMKHWVLFYRKENSGNVRYQLFAIYDYQIDDMYIDSIMLSE